MQKECDAGAMSKVYSYRQNPGRSSNRFVSLHHINLSVTSQARLDIGLRIMYHVDNRGIQPWRYEQQLYLVTTTCPLSITPRGLYASDCSCISRPPWCLSHCPLGYSSNFCSTMALSAENRWCPRYDPVWPLAQKSFDPLQISRTGYS